MTMTNLDLDRVTIRLSDNSLSEQEIKDYLRMLNIEFGAKNTSANIKQLLWEAIQARKSRDAD